jgi:hypothetical protein
MDGRRVTVTFTGFEPFWMRLMADELDRLHGDTLSCRWVPWPSTWGERLQFVLAMRSSDVAVRVGMPFEFSSETNALWLRWVSASRRTVGVNYWIGSDVRIYLERLAAGTTGARDAEAVAGLVHFAGADNLTEALRGAGVSARTVVVPSPEREAPPEPSALPAEFRVLSYWSDANFETNGGPSLIDAARRLPDVSFEVMGTTGAGVRAVPSNVSFLGKVDDVAACYERASVVVRAPVWDSVPSAVVEEGLLFARHVIYTFDFPHTVRVPFGDAGALADAIAALRDAHASGGLGPNLQGRAFIEDYGAAGPRWDAMATALLDASRGTGRRTRALLVGQAKWTRVLADGLSRHADVETDAIPIDTASDALRMLSPARFRRADVVVRVGFRPGAHTVRGRVFDTVFEMMRPAATPVVYYWLGTDVLNVRHDAEAGVDQRRFHEMAAAATHLADSDALRDDLAALGIQSTTAWLPAPNAPQEGDVAALPERFTVLTYVPDARSEFYDGPTLVEVARRLPEASFSVVGGTGGWAADAPGNVEFLGWRGDMPALYDASSALVRLVEHDSVSCMAVEALAHGRAVIYSREYPNAIRVPFGDVDALESALRKVMERAATGQPVVSPEAVAWARATAEPSACYGDIATVLRAAAGGRR